MFANENVAIFEWGYLSQLKIYTFTGRFSYCNSVDPERWADWQKSYPNIPRLIFQVTAVM